MYYVLNKYERRETGQLWNFHMLHTRFNYKNSGHITQYGPSIYMKIPNLKTTHKEKGTQNTNDRNRTATHHTSIRLMYTE
jgi:hypothetical protein